MYPARLHAGPFGQGMDQARWRVVVDLARDPAGQVGQVEGVEGEVEVAQQLRDAQAVDGGQAVQPRRQRLEVPWRWVQRPRPHPMATGPINVREAHVRVPMSGLT